MSAPQRLRCLLENAKKKRRDDEARSGRGNEMMKRRADEAQSGRGDETMKHRADEGDVEMW
jgi:hypothetical protein